MSNPLEIVAVMNPNTAATSETGTINTAASTVAPASTVVSLPASTVAPATTVTSLSASTGSAEAPRPSVGQSGNQENVQISEVEKLRKELDEMKDKAGVNTVDGAIKALQALVGRPSALFDAYAAIAALEEVVYAAQKLNDDRASKYNIILRKCRPLVAEHSLQSVLTKLVASKEEAEIAKTIDKALKLQMNVQAPVLQQYRAPFAGRTNRFPAPYNRRYRGPRRCFSCNQEGHIARFCPNNSNTKRR